MAPALGEAIQLSISITKISSSGAVTAQSPVISQGTMILESTAIRKRAAQGCPSGSTVLLHPYFVDDDQVNNV